MDCLLFLVVFGRAGLMLFALSLVKPSENLGACAIVLNLLLIERISTPLQQTLIDGNMASVVILLSRLLQMIRCVQDPVSKFAQFFLESLWSALSLCMIWYFRGSAKEVAFGIAVTVLLGGGLTCTWAPMDDFVMYAIRSFNFIALCIMLHAVDPEPAMERRHGYLGRLRFLGCCTPVLLLDKPFMTMFNVVATAMLILRLRNDGGAPERVGPHADEEEDDVESGLI